MINIRPFPEGTGIRALEGSILFRQMKADPETRTVVWPNGADLDPDVLYAKIVPLELPEEIGT